jgi:drug/metabolite transporter (DMT)-like permease
VVWVALLAVPLLGERLRGAPVAAVALLVGGLVVLDDGLAGFGFGDGELLILAAALLWSVEIVLVKRLLRGVSPARSGLAGLDAEGWGWALLTGAVLAAYVATWFTALSRAPAIDVPAILVAGAVLTGLLNAFVKGIPLPTVDLAGMALLLAGAAVVAASATARRHALEPVS